MFGRNYNFEFFAIKVSNEKSTELQKDQISEKNVSGVMVQTSDILKTPKGAVNFDSSRDSNSYFSRHFLTSIVPSRSQSKV